MTIKSRKLQLTKRLVQSEKFINELKEKPYVIYPKEYEAYIGLSIIIIVSCAISLFIFFPEFKKIYNGGPILDSFYIIMMIVLICSSMCVYYLVHIICLLTRRIKIELGENYVKFRGAIRTKVIYIGDIGSITKKSGYRQSQMKIIEIRRIKHYLNRSNRTIRFEDWWFDESDIGKLFYYINMYNKRAKYKKLIDTKNIDITNLKDNFFSTSMFIYDEINKVYICPNGEKLIHTSRKTTTGKQIYSSIDYVCVDCKFKQKCIKPTKTVRIIAKRD